jgi:putative ABC transport system permease protein
MRRLQSALIAFELAGSLALLVGCGLMMRSIVNLVRTDLGFEMAHVGYAHLVLPATYGSPPALLAFYEPLAERLSTSSRSPIALADFIPFSEGPKQPVQCDDGARAAQAASVRAVNAGYFATLGIDILQGRTFSASDRLDGEPVAVVSETLARQLWPNVSPLGRRLLAGEPPREGDPPLPWRTVVGVVSDVRQSYADDDLRDVYLSFSQVPSRFTSLYLRTDQPVSSWLPVVRGAIAEINPFVAINASGALAGEDRQLAGTTFLTSMLTVSAAFTAFLALLGIYGVTAYAVQQREREIAIRMALGATGGTIIRMFLKQRSIVLIAGLACGLLGAIVVARMLEHQIHGVKPFDLMTFVATCALLTITAALATWWPAKRAANRNPSGLLNES